MNTTKNKQQKIARRHKKIRTQISGTSDKPRLSVFRSNKYIAIQLVDDEKGHTLAAMTTKDAKGKTPSEKAKEIGAEIAKKAKALKIDKVVFDRGGYLYTGNIKALADSAREGGLKF